MGPVQLIIWDFPSGAYNNNREGSIINCMHLGSGEGRPLRASHVLLPGSTTSTHITLHCPGGAGGAGCPGKLLEIVDFHEKS